MKILCVVRNYAPHAGEMQAPLPAEPTFFLKPDSALNPKQLPMFYPDFTHDLQHEVEVVVRIDRVGKCIEPRFAHKYYNSVALGIDFTARDLQRRASQNGQPWTICKGFDGSAAIGEWVPKEKFLDVQRLHFHLDIDGHTVQEGCTTDMLYSVDEIISYISRFFTLKTGDLLYTGTPSGVGPVHIGNNLEGWLEERKVLDLHCR